MSWTNTEATEEKQRVNLQLCHVLQHHVWSSELRLWCGKGFENNALHLTFKEALKKDTDKIIETQQGTDDFFVGLHDDVNSRANTFVHKLWKRQQKTDYITYKTFLSPAAKKQKEANVFACVCVC